MNFSNYIAYFKTAAVNHKELLHVDDTNVTFYRMDIEEVLTGLRYKLKSKSLILESPEKNTRDAFSDNPRKIITGAFLIVGPVKKNDFTDEVAVLDKCEEISEDILSKIVNDCSKFKRNSSWTGAIKGFDPNSIRSQKVGPLFDNFYGWRTEFQINQTHRNNLKLDASKWNNETAFTI